MNDCLQTVRQDGVFLDCDHGNAVARIARARVCGVAFPERRITSIPFPAVDPPGARTDGRAFSFGIRRIGGSPSWTTRIVWLVAIGLSAGTHERAVGWQAGFQGFFERTFATDDHLASIEGSPAIINMFLRVDDGINRRDWKYAIDSLQRIIAGPVEGMIPLPNPGQPDLTLYESSRRRATEILAGLAPEGLRAYRMLYDGRAGRLYIDAVTHHDEESLRQVIDRYLLTRYGDDAVDLLASWYLDEGRPAAALALLRRLRMVYPDTDVPATTTATKEAAALLLLGDERAAAAILSAAYRGDADSESTGGRLSIDELKSIEGTAGDVWGLPGSGSWRLPGGGARRLGRMSAVTPTLIDRDFWTYELGSGRTGAWPPVITDDGWDDPPLPPAAHLVADAGRLFVRTRDGCTAFDMDGLTPLWRSRSGVAVAASLAEPGDGWSSVATGFSASSTDLAFEDELLNDVGVAFGLYLTVERTGTSPYVGGDSVRGAAHGWRAPVLDWAEGAGLENGTRIIAYDCATGAIRWQRGRSRAPDDPLRAVDFRSVPVAVGDELWVPYVSRDDLFIGVLDPSDGTLERRILLCSVSDSPGGYLEATPPAVGDGVVYVPTGRGMLIAVDAARYRVQWAAAYLTRDDNKDNWSPWLSAPPIVTGQVVLLAPTDHSDLFAFSAETGAIQWSRAVDGAQYMIAASSEHVWLGGRAVSCETIASGSPVWSRAVDSPPVGRAVMSGGVIHVPTMTGLVTMDVSTGIVVGERTLPESLDPLGNLLCVDGSMFSIDPTRIRKFPDLDAGYRMARARHVADPAVAEHAVRLAWLELVRGDAQGAHDIISSNSAPPRSKPADGDDDMARLWIEVLLALADTESTETARAFAYLDDAWEIARDGGDALRVGLAIGEQLYEAGRAGEAYHALWSLGRGPDADRPLRFGNRVTGRARDEIARRLSKIAADLSSDDVETVRENAQAAAQDLARALHGPGPRREARAELSALADLGTIGGVAEFALFELGGWALRQERYAEAEQLLSECVRMGGASDTALAARMLLGDLYRTPMLSVYSSLADVLAVLEERFARHPISSLYDRADRAATTIGEWVSAMRVELAQPRVDAHRRFSARAGFEFAGRALVLRKTETREVRRRRRVRVWRSTTPRIVNFSEPEAPALAERIVLYTASDTLECYDTRHGRLLWSASLRLPERFFRFDPPRFGFRSDPGQPLAPRHAAVEGQTMILPGRDALYAVGLGSGKRLWARPFESSRADEDDIAPGSVPAVGRGMVAAILQPGKLSCLRTVDGTTIWRRDLGGRAARSVRMYGSRVVATDALGETTWIVDRSDGRLIRRLDFHQPDSEAGSVSLVETDGVLAGPGKRDGLNSVSAVELATGKILWEHVVDKPIVQLFSPADGMIGVGILAGDVRVLDAATGDVLFKQHVAGAWGIRRGLLIEDVLVLVDGDPEDDRFDGQLIALDYATGDERWRREAILPARYRNGELRSYDGLLPVIAEVARHEGERYRSVRLGMLDLRTGVDVGEQAELLRAVRDRPELNGDVTIRPGGVFVGDSEQIRKFQTRPIVRDPAGEL